MKQEHSMTDYITLSLLALLLYLVHDDGCIE
jgi:hypothetical protein